MLKGMEFMKIKNIFKTLIMATIISVSMISMAFADEDFNKNHLLYINDTEKLSDGTILYKYNNGSWYSINKITNKSIFKDINNIKENDYPDEFCLADYKSKYESKFDININNINYIFVSNIGKHSDKIYSDDLSTNEKLSEYAKQWLKYNYDLTLDVPIQYYNKLDNETYGYFCYKDYKATIIYINENIKDFNIIVERTLQHELTHYALFELKKPYLDDDEYFKNECIKNGAVTNDNKCGLFHSHLQCTV
jgi:hypothetical protein